MKKNSYLILIIILCFVLIGCPIPDRYGDTVTYDYENNSDEDIVIITKKEIGENHIVCPDTTLPEIAHGSGSLCDTLKKGKVKQTFIYNHNCDTIRIFILSKDTVDKYTWEEIRQDYNIIRRYDMHINNNDLKKLGYYIYYPPTEAMQNIRMYPPYE
ncbi:MAG: hypothetical protein LBH30_03460 [Prevotellaceae bacterium]|jgi:hypothetical protein|nr:hypothetical protein [Prevotellaceae bacterium]